MGLEPIKLTPREYDVLIRLAKPKKKIAEELGVSVGMVAKYYWRLSAKITSETRAELVLKAQIMGLVDLDDFIL